MKQNIYLLVNDREILKFYVMVNVTIKYRLVISNSNSTTGEYILI